VITWNSIHLHESPISLGTGRLLEDVRRCPVDKLRTAPIRTDTRIIVVRLVNRDLVRGGFYSRNSGDTVGAILIGVTLVRRQGTLACFFGALLVGFENVHKVVESVVVS
jgi:hypothetical protein